MQRTKSESWLAIVVGAGLTGDGPELDASEATCVLPVVVGAHLVIELGIPEQGDEPTRKVHFAHEVPALKL